VENTQDDIQAEPSLLFLPNDANKSPLKTKIAAKAVAAMVCCCGRPITNAITNVIAPAAAPKGIILSQRWKIYPLAVVPFLIARLQII
jgi:hypothetical protein